MLVAAALIATAPAAASAERRTVILRVAINELAAGDHIVYLEDDGDVLVPVEALRGIGVRVHGRTEQVDGALCVALRSMTKDYVLDEDQMTIAITARPSDLPATRIDLARGAPPDLQVRDATSAYLNYGVQAVGTALTAFTEAGARHGRGLLYSSVTLTPDHRVVRGLSNLTIDHREQLQTFVIGDQVVDGGPLGGGAVVGGLHLIRSFELDPYLVTSPAIDLSGSVLAPATAEIYVNGVLVRREQLPPGRYTVANLPATTGAGDARVVIRDVLGRRQEVSTGFYVAGNLLRPGLSDYHVTAGSVRGAMGMESFGYGAVAAVARYRRGVTSRITVGARADAAIEHGGAGASMTAGLPVGQLDVAAGVSADRGALGAAGSLGWSYLARRGALALSGRLVSDGYATVDVDRDADRVVAEARAHASLSLARRVTAGARFSSVAFRDVGWSRRYSLHASASPARGATLSVSVERSDEEHGTQYSAFASLSVGLSSRTRASLSHHHRGGGDTSQVALSRSLGGETGLGYRASAEVGARDAVAASVQAQSSTGRYELGYTYRGTDHGTLEASVAGGLAVIGGRVFASRPIDNSFALVRVPGNAGVETSIENHPVGRTDRHGDLFIPRLLPHYGNNISIDPGDLPFDRLLPVTRQTIAPPVGGGVVIVFAAPALHVVRGTLIIEEGASTRPPAYGELTVGGSTSPINATGNFELAGLQGGRHAAVVEWDGKRCAFDLFVPTRAAMIIELGTLVCR